MKTFMIIVISLLAATAFYPADKNGYEVGDKASDFELKNVDGEMVSLSDFEDAKGFIITFTCNSCPIANLYEQRIIDLHKKYAPKGYPVIAINPNDADKQPDDSFENMKTRAEEKNYPFPYVMDDTQKITREFGATNTPHMYVLQKEGSEYMVKYIGAIDNNPKEPEKASKKFINDALDALIEGKEVPVEQTKAVGCSIKWKSA
jgi:peroxiredoxin